MKMIRTLNMFLQATMTLIGCKDSKMFNQQNVAEVTYSIDSTTVNMEGIITDAKNDCWADEQQSEIESLRLVVGSEKLKVETFESDVLELKTMV